MTPDDLTRLREQLKVDEGWKPYAYQDSRGYWTIGYGRLIDALKGGGVTVEEGEYLLSNDIRRVLDALEAFDWYTLQDDVRQAALANMAYNLGAQSINDKWPHLVAALRLKDYTSATDILKGSLWHTQVGARADRIIQLIETGRYV